MLRASAVFAIVVGLILALMEVRANWGDWQWWPFWLVDFVAAVLLIFGGLRTLRNFESGRHWLTAGWAFTFAMAWMSLAGNVSAGPDPERDARLGGAYLMLVGLLVAAALAGLILAVAARTKGRT